MRHTRPLLLFVLAVVVLAPRGLRAQQPFSERDRADIAALLTRMVATARQAWDTRNASLLVPDSTVTVRTPQGGTLTAAQLRADLQRRMDMTTRVDTLVELLDSIRVITPDSVLAYSSQRFVRVIRLEDGSERQRISRITHERPVTRTAGRWAMTGAIREIAPRAWWANEVPAPPATAPLATPSSPQVDSVRALDSAWARTYAMHDTVLAASLLSDRFVMTSADGRLKDKAAELADIRPAVGLRMHHFRTSDLRIELYAGAAIVIGVADWAFSYNGQENAFRRRYTAVYAREDHSSWRLVALHMGRAP